MTVSDQDSLASVLAIAFEKGISQFPVLSDERFGGLITENEITRWLGRRTTAHMIEVNLAAVTVSSKHQGTLHRRFACRSKDKAGIRSRV